MMKLLSSAFFLGAIRQTNVERCHHYAREALTDVFHTEAVSSFLCHQLLERMNGGQAIMCEFVPTALSLQTAQHTRQAI